MRTCVLVWCVQTTHGYEDHSKEVAYARIGIMHWDSTWVRRLFHSTCVHAYWCDVFTQHMGMKIISNTCVHAYGCDAFSQQTCMNIISEYMRTYVSVWCIQTTHGYEDHFREVACARIGIMLWDNTWVWRLFQSTCVHPYWCGAFSQDTCMEIISEYMRTCVLV